MRSDSRSVRGLFAAAGLFAAGSALGAEQAPAADVASARLVAPWKTVATSGQVEAHPPAIHEVIWHAVARGEELRPQTAVRTGKKGRATLARNGSILIVDRDSRVDLPAVVPQEGSSSVMQTQGRVVYKIEKADSKHFEVVTPYLVAGVKGTTFMVTVKDHAASVSVQEGTVEVASPMTGEKMDVHAGETVLVGNDTESRMELVTSRPVDDGRRAGKSESADRARSDASRMASLLDAGDPTTDTARADAKPDPVEDLAGLASGDAAADLGGMVDAGKRSAGDGIDTAIDPMRDPIDSLPVDARSELEDASTAPLPGGTTPVPGTSGPGTSGPGSSGPGSSIPTPGDTDSSGPGSRLPTRS